MRLTRIQLALGCFCLATIGAIVGIEVWPEPALSQSSATTSEVSAVDVTAGATQSVSSLTELRARPPFWPDRRPPAPVVVAAAVAPPIPAPPPPPAPGAELTLVGIANGPDARIAIVRVKSTGKVERHSEGEAIDQWTVKRILVDRIVLVRGGSENELAFPPPGERKAGSPPLGSPQRMPLPPVPPPPAPARR